MFYSIKRLFFNDFNTVLTVIFTQVDIFGLKSNGFES